jgi:hypothetical protein
LGQYHSQQMAEPNPCKAALVDSPVRGATTINEPLKFRTALYRRRAQSSIECAEDGGRTGFQYQKPSFATPVTRVARHSERVRKI